MAASTADHGRRAVSAPPPPTAPPACPLASGHGLRPGRGGSVILGGLDDNFTYLTDAFAINPTAFSPVS